MLQFNSVAISLVPLGPFIMRSSTRLCLLVLAGAFVNFLPLEVCKTTSTAFAQNERNELGKRLRRFEQLWESSTPDIRARSVAAMENAVSNFFSLKLLDAGRSLDQAAVALHQTTSGNDPLPWVYSQRLELAPAVADTSQQEIKITLKPFYPLGGTSDSNSESIASSKIQLSIFPVTPNHSYALSFDPTESPAQQSEWLETKLVEQGWTWPELSLPEGDYFVVAKLQIEQKEFEIVPTLFSRVDNLRLRLEAIVNASEDLPKSSPRSSGIATLRSHSLLLENIVEGSIQEIDYPFNHLMQACEVLIATAGDCGALLDDPQRSDTWLTLAADRRTAFIRLRLPNIQTPEKQTEAYPVLFLFHGAGGSENMFFETYGAGRAVELAAERGWIVVAPRQRLLGGIGLNCEEMLDELSNFLPIDRNRVFFLGHSMGASQAVQQATLAPELPAAVVALGGGGRLGRQSKVADNWFVAAGDRDFGKGSAKGLASALSTLKKSVLYREYPQTEHMVIVQAALDDAFKFLDEAK